MYYCQHLPKADLQIQLRSGIWHLISLQFQLRPPTKTREGPSQAAAEACIQLVATTEAQAATGGVPANLYTLESIPMPLTWKSKHHYHGQPAWASK